MNTEAKWFSFSKLNSLITLFMLISFVSFGQTVKVTFNINTAGVPDTLNENSTIQVRGDTPLTWDNNSVKATYVSGDYWKATVDYPANSTKPYKFFTNAKSVTTGDDGGWEGDSGPNNGQDNGNRNIQVGSTDTTIDVQWVNGWNDAKPVPFTTPYTAHEGKFVVWVRVNMQGWAGFDTTTMKVGIRGSTMSGGDPENLSWGSTTFLKAEKPHANGGSRQYDSKYFWSGPVYINDADAGKGLRFKFLLLDKNATSSTDWGDMIKNPDVQYEVTTSGNDTTLAWKWFNNQRVVNLGGNDNITLNFTVDLDKAITNNGFNPETDTLYVKAGLNSTANSLVSLKLDNTGGTIYEGTAEVTSILNTDLQYAFFKAYKNAQDARAELKEFYFDNYDLQVGSNQENRKIKLTGSTVNVSDEAPDNTSSHRSPYFKNTTTMAQNTAIILEADYRPALNEVKVNGASLVDGQNQSFVVDASNIDGFSVYVNGPLTRILDATDWATWNEAGMTEGRKMYDDGTHGDLVAGDSIHTTTFNWTTETDGASVSQIFKFGIKGGDNEAGYGNNHIYNVKAGQAEQRVRAAFGDIQPSRYPHWDYVNKRANNPPPPPEKVKVTFIINTAGVPDTLNANSTIQVRGDTPLTWDNNSVKATHISGDYWTATVEYPSNSVKPYKFFTNAKSVITGDDGGWEGDSGPNNGQDNGNRNIQTGYSDTVLNVQWVNGWNDAKPVPYTTPYTAHEGKFVVWVRVNMEGWSGFDTTTMKVGIRGSTMSGGDPENLSWGSTTFLKAEKPHANGGSRQYNGKYFWSGPVYINDADAGKGLRFKFLLLDKNATASTDWGDMIKNPDVQYEVTTSGNDTTLAWKWFNNQRPKPFTGTDVVKLNFTVDLDKAITNNGFNPETDTLYVKAGLNTTATEIVSLKLDNTGGTIYEGTTEVTSELNSKLQYAFFKAYKNAQDARAELKEFYFDNYDLQVGSNQENRKIDLTSLEVNVSDEATDNTSSHRSPYFKNTTTMAQNTAIILEVDYRPALNEVKVHNASLVDGQNQSFIVDASNIDGFAVYVNGPLTRILDATDWATWNEAGMTEGRKMYDDGTHGDLVAGDSIHTTTFNWTTATDGASVSQIFKFGIKGGDNEAGYGNNHIYNVKAGQAEQRVRAAFGDIQPSRYPHWDYVNKRHTSVTQKDNVIPTDYVLGQNYPNPFNPSTVIPFSVPKAGLVRIEIYNMVGQKIMEFSEVVTAAGNYTKTFNGSNLTSGTYLYKIMSGNFVQTKKMMLVK